MDNVGSLFSQEQWQLWLPLGGAALAALVFVLRAYERRRGARLERVVEAKLAPRLLAGYDGRVRKPLFWLAVIGFAALVLALAQPRIGQAWVDVQKRSRDILIVLDTSESMNAADPAPSRLARARQKVESLMARSPADRFGLVAFAGAAALQCPLTLDHNYFRSVLDAVNTDTLSIKGSDLASGLLQAVDVFEEDAKRGEGGEGTRAIVFISDGEQVSGDAARAAQRAAAVADIFVLAIGSGEGASVVRPDWLRLAGATGPDRVHHSRLNPETLQAVARDPRAYVPLTPDNSDVERLHEQLEELGTRAVASEVRERMTNRFQWPLALALLCFSGEGAWIVLMPRVRVWRMKKPSREAAT